MSLFDFLGDLDPIRASSISWVGMSDSFIGYCWFVVPPAAADALWSGDLRGDALLLLGEGGGEY